MKDIGYLFTAFSRSDLKPNYQIDASDDFCKIPNYNLCSKSRYKDGICGYYASNILVKLLANIESPRLYTLWLKIIIIAKNIHA